MYFHATRTRPRSRMEVLAREGKRVGAALSDAAFRAASNQWHNFNEVELVHLHERRLALFAFTLSVAGAAAAARKTNLNSNTHPPTRRAGRPTALGLSRYEQY